MCDLAACPRRVRGCVVLGGMGYRAPSPLKIHSPTARSLLLRLSLVLLILAAGIAGFLLGSSTSDEPGWPTYAPMFDRVAPVVVSVSVEEPELKIGSGFAVSETEVITSRHLIVDATSVIVRDIGGWALPAEVVGTDARTDLALLRVRDGGLRPAQLGQSSTLRVGDTVLAIGNPYGLGHSLSVGVVGHRGRRRLSPDAEGGPRVDFLQLSLPLNPGNSGGPIFDREGLVVGVLSGTHAQGQAIAFAVPIEVLSETLPALRRGARVSRAFLGIGTRMDGQSVVVRSVIPSSPADRAGIRPGDAISAIDGQLVASPEAVQAVLDQLSGGSRVSVRLLREGQLQILDVTLADWASQAVVVGGMTLRPAPGAGGEVVAVRPRSRAEHAGVRVGDVVRSVNGVPVRAPADVKERLSGGAPSQLDLVRDGVPLQLQLGEPG